jgi:hypothetical protein
MPLLEVTQVRHVSASIRLTDTTAILTDQYALFIHACADDVIEQALTYAFSKDRDFQEFLKTPVAVVEKEACFCGAIGCANNGRSGGIKGMIHRPDQWQSHNGASHRKKIDTPPLIGCCVGTKVPCSEPLEITRFIKFAVPYKEPRQ